jgi:diguanylate cyclase (GGDEF)-like protein
VGGGLDAAEHRVALIVIVVAGYAVAGTMLGVRGLPAAAFEGITALGTALISAVVVLDAVASSPYALFLVWLAVHAFYFLPWRRATAQLAFMVVVYGVALLVAPSHHDEREVRFAMEVGTLVVTAAFVGLLKARVDRLVVRLSDAARRDFLTGLLNRRGFEDALDLELERVQRGDRPLSLLLIDIDHFKLVNDRYGHHVGDATLVTVAGALDGVRRRIDTVARTGGEEFVLLMPASDEAAAMHCCERALAAIRGADWSSLAPGLAVTASAGIARSGEALGLDRIAALADRRLYDAKRLGRDRAVSRSITG